jgi:hypothetical protein
MRSEAAVLAACAANLQAHSFVVLSTLSEAAHKDEDPQLYSSSCFADVAARWERRVESQPQRQGRPCQISIRACPLLACPLTSNAFVLPAAAAAAVDATTGGYAAGMGHGPGPC